jgi:hypothetical protein
MKDHLLSVLIFEIVLLVDTFHPSKLLCVSIKDVTPLSPEPHLSQK